MVAAAAALLIVALWISAPGVSQDKAPKEPDAEQMMAQWAQLNAKGPEHERFAKMVGTWDTEMKMWMAPGTEPMVSKGTARFELMLDGRYVRQDFQGEMMGKPFTGVAIDGYDRIKKKYVSIWMDSESTGIYVSEGLPAGNGTYVYYGEMDDPMTGVHDKIAKSVARELSDDKLVFEMYDQPPGSDEFKTMEITYTRRK
jgi:hypothetical protein